MFASFNRIAMLSAVWIVFAGAFANAEAAGPPEAVMKMLNEAARDGSDPGELELTAMLAKRAYPEAALEIDRTVRRLERQRQRHKVVAEAPRSLRDGWTGEGEFGASASGGNTNETSINLGFKAERETATWGNTFVAKADYKKSAGTTTVERFLANHQSKYKFDGKLYGVSLLQWESDKFAGFDNRFSESAGLGYSLKQARKWTWDVTAGPAFRQTSRVDRSYEADIEARLSSHIAWFLTPGTTVTQDTNLFLGPGNNTYQAVTALTTKVIGAISARASFDYKRETSPPPGLVGQDTVSRLTLVYGF